MIDLPSDLDSVVRRWFPAGVDTISAGREVSPSGVFVTGVSGAGAGSVADELDLLAGRPLPRASDAFSAAVVLFVIDASAPLGRTALAELTPVLESTTTGVLINKIDVHRNWRDIQRLVSESIAEHVPRAVDVSFWPTSAKLAERARVAVDPAMRTSLSEESGIGELVRFVAAALDQPESVLQERKYCAAVREAAVGARREIVKKARVVTGASATAGLRSERARLLEVRDLARAERAAALRSRVQMARSETVHDIDDAVRAFSSSARESIDRAKRAELGHVRAELVDRLAATAAGVDSRLTARLLAIDSDLGLSADLPASPGPAVEVPSVSPRGAGIEDRVMIVVGASAGVGIGRLAVSPLTLVPGLDIAMIPISLLLGAMCAWWLVSSRRLIADRAHTRTWVVDAAAGAKSTLEQAALTHVLSADAALTTATHTVSRAVASAAETEVERVEGELRAAGDQRAAVLAACDRDLLTLDRGVERFSGPVRTS